jgi:hypothetical protein
MEEMYRWLIERWRLLAAGLDDRGSPTVETVLIAAGLAALAIAVVAVILVKVMSVAHHIPTN